MGNVYMEAEQVRFKGSTYHNVQDGLKAALEGGGGGGTTVVANPEGSATADLAKLQVGETIYGIPAEAGDISYDNTSSGMTADDVQEAIDELNTGISGITELIPSDATSFNKLVTAGDIPDAVTGNPTGTATAGDLTKLQIGSDIYSIPSGGSGGNAYGVFSTTETEIGTWLGSTLYRKVIDCGNLGAGRKNVAVPAGINVIKMYGYVNNGQSGSGENIFGLPYVQYDATLGTFTIVPVYEPSADNIAIISSFNTSAHSAVLVIEYTKNS